MDVPCKDCPDRTATCHCECEKYRIFAAWCEERRQKRAEEKATHRAETHGLRRAIAIRRYKERHERK